MKVTLRRCNVFTRYHRCSYLELSDCTPVLFLMARDASLLVATCHRVSTVCTCSSDDVSMFLVER